MKNGLFKIAIVGLGPKGLYGLERILAQLQANSIVGQVEIHLFNKTDFMGSGDVYRSDQPCYLLMNFSNKFIQMWSQETPPPIVSNSLRFSEYLSQKQQKPAEALDLLYASRATVGEYLEQGYADLCQNLPEHITLYEHIAEVTSIEKTGERYTILYTGQREMHQMEGFHNILITTGHQRHKLPQKHRADFIPFIYPVTDTLKGVNPQHTVAIKGMGLTFIDAALALTEGRGGAFEIATDGAYTYQTSGKEPKHIFPFSKSGWPMLPKDNFSFNDNKDTLYIENVKYLNNNTLNFEMEILPLLKQDMEQAYYHTLFGHEKEVFSKHEDYEKVKEQIKYFHRNYPKYPRFDFEKLLEPDFQPGKSSHQNVLDYLIAFTAKETMDIVHKAQLRAAAIWKKFSPVFNEIYSFSGLDAFSHQNFDNYYFGKLNRIAYGPPPENLKKILALAQAGIVDFRFARNPKIKTLYPGFTLSNDTCATSCDILIDARIPKNDIDKEASGLFRSLCENQLARPYVNRDNTTDYLPGTVEINRDGNLINPLGNTENITLYGTPTEGMVHDNDTLSRTRNNFASPWARGVIQQIKEVKNECNNHTPQSIPYMQ